MSFLVYYIWYFVFVLCEGRKLEIMGRIKQEEKKGKKLKFGSAMNPKGELSV